MTTPFFQRLKHAARVIFKSGAPFPFNKIMPYDATGGEKLYAPYRQSAWVQRAIKKVAGPIAAVNLDFTLNGEACGDPSLDSFWRCPAAGMTRQEFFEATIGWLKLAGEAFWILDDTSLLPFPNSTPGANPFFNPFQRPSASPAPGSSPFPQLVVARPDRMTHLVRDGQLMGWQYVDAAGHHVPLLPEQVIQTKLWNPYDDWRGLSELHSCHDAAEADYMAGKFNLNLMRNNGDQGVFVIAKSGLPVDSQRQQIIDQLREKRELAQRGVFKPVFLTGDLQIEDAKIKTPDADFVANRLENRHEIFLAFGVPPSMADVRAAYSIGSASDWFILIAETCIPAGEKICHSINRVLRRQTGLDIVATLDWDEHPVIQAVRRERVETAQKYWSMGVPLKVLNDYLDLKLPECQGWDKGYLPFNIAPTADISQPVTPPAGDAGFSEPLDDTIALMRQALGSHLSDPPHPFDPFHSSPPLESPPSSDDHDCSPSSLPDLAVKDPTSSRWSHYMLQRRETIKSYESRLGRELMKARAEVLQKLEAGGRVSPRDLFASIGRAERGDAPILLQKSAADFMFSLADWSLAFHTALRPIHEAALQRAGDQLFDELNIKDPFAIPPEEIAKFVPERENSLSRVPDEIFEGVRAALQEGMDCGDSVEDLANRVRATFNAFSKERATRIALTETAAAYGTGRYLAMKQAGVRRQEWLSSRNANVRPAHRAADGQVVPIDEAFIVHSESLRYPGDPNGSPANVKNCHCVAVPSLSPS